MVWQFVDIFVFSFIFVCSSTLDYIIGFLSQCEIVYTHTEWLIGLVISFFVKALLSPFAAGNYNLFIKKIIFITQNWHYLCTTYTIAKYKQRIMTLNGCINSIISVWFSWIFFCVWRKQNTQIVFTFIVRGFFFLHTPIPGGRVSFHTAKQILSPSHTRKRSKGIEMDRKGSIASTLEMKRICAGLRFRM